MQPETLTPSPDYVKAVIAFDEGDPLRRPPAAPHTTLTVLLHTPLVVVLEYVRLVSRPLALDGPRRLSATYGRQAVSTFIRLLQTGWQGVHRLQLNENLCVVLDDNRIHLRRGDATEAFLDAARTVHALSFVEAALPLFGWVDPTFELGPPGIAAFDRQRGCWYPPGPHNTSSY